MLLRLILVGLVTSLSLELPSGRDVSSWAETGRAWANARIAGLENPEVAAVAPAIPADAAPTPDQADQQFQDVVGAMAAGFAADSTLPVAEAQLADAAPRATAAPAVEVAAEVEVAADDAAALPDGEELAAVAPAEAEPVAVATTAMAEEAGAEIEAEGDDASSRADRLADAVRLTREAAEAWAAVIGAPAAEVDCGR